MEAIPVVAPANVLNNNTGILTADTNCCPRAFRCRDFQLSERLTCRLISVVVVPFAVATTFIIIAPWVRFVQGELPLLLTVMLSAVGDLLLAVVGCAFVYYLHASPAEPSPV